jgi:hypothetical protein
MVKSCYDELNQTFDARHGEDRGRIVESIRSRNRGARIEFLEKFSQTQLRDYLRHLEHAEEPRGASWVRPSGNSGITWRESRI